MEQVVERLARQAQSQFLGKYRGFVVDNKDPETRGRLKLRVPSVLGEQDTGWALPCSPFGGLANQGLFMVPEVEAQVWVEFEEGNIQSPIWVGVFWQQSSDIPEEAAIEEPTTRMLRTPSGHVLQFDDADGDEQFRLAHPAGTEMIIDPQGTVNITDAGGNSFTMDAENNSIVIEDSNGNTMTMDSSGTVIEDSNGSKIEMTAAGITAEAPKIVVKGGQVHLGDEGGEPVIKGQSFLSMFATHIHTVAPVVGGPTSPPIPQGEMSTLSTTVKTI